MYIIKVCCKGDKFYYFYPSTYGGMITWNPFEAMKNGFKTIGEAKSFFNDAQDSFKQLTLGANVDAVKIESVQTSFEDVEIIANL